MSDISVKDIVGHLRSVISTNHALQDRLCDDLRVFKDSSVRRATAERLAHVAKESDSCTHLLGWIEDFQDRASIVMPEPPRHLGRSPSHDGALKNFHQAEPIGID